MKPKKPSSNPEAMKDILEPLQHIREVNPPIFLKDRIMARISAMEERITLRFAAVAFAGFAILLLLTTYAASCPQTAASQIAAGLIQDNNLY